MVKKKKNDRLLNSCQHTHLAKGFLNQTPGVIPSSDSEQRLRNPGEPESLELPKVFCQGEEQRERIGEGRVRWGQVALAEEAALGEGLRSRAS